MILYGGTGLGKTSFASQFGRVGFMIDSQEQGIYYLMQRGLVPTPAFVEEFPDTADSWKKSLDFLARVPLMDIDTIVVETLTGWQKICFKDHAKRRFRTNEYPDGDMTNGPNGFYSYSKGPKNAANFDFPDFVERLNLCTRAGKNVIVTGHCYQKQITDVMGEIYQKMVPACEEQLWLAISRWASIVAYIHDKAETDREKSRGQLKKTAKSETHRYIYCQPSPFFEAKNWWGMRQPVVNCGDDARSSFVNFMTALG